MSEREVKKCPKCGRKLLVDAKFCYGCGGLVEKAAVEEVAVMETDSKQKDTMTDFLKGLWKIFGYPLMICFSVSFVLYWLTCGLYWELARWAWLGVIMPWVFFLGLFGIMAVSHPETFHTTKEYILFSLIFLGVPIVLLILTILMFLGFLPFPIISGSDTW